MRTEGRDTIESGSRGEGSRTVRTDRTEVDVSNRSNRSKFRNRTVTLFIGDGSNSKHGGTPDEK